MIKSPFPEIPDAMWKTIVSEPHNFEHRLACAEHIREANSGWAMLIEFHVKRYQRFWAGEDPGPADSEALPFHQDQWLGPLGHPGIHGCRCPALTRGFAEFVCGPVTSLINHWSELAAAAPVRSFAIRDEPPVDATKLGRSPLVDQVIGFEGGDLNVAQLRALGDAGVFRNVKYITVGITRIQVIDPFKVFDYFAASQCAPRLRELRVSIAHQDRYKRISQGPGKYCWNANNYFDPAEAAPEIEATYGPQPWLYPERQTPRGIVPGTTMY